MNMFCAQIYNYLLSTGLTCDQADNLMESQNSQIWAIVQDDVWDMCAPEHRARKYEEQAIADSKLPEVC
jgi:hypothetical protein